ncbi:endonuclease/exonuclease/phosphatase family protein [uncultured Methanosphaera sp.]|uniref:endonuclease/exonuclease/phosphatase family protein n=1 Tax=uncultured Methanosphaera sp. TaxID=262501 RepID=UPI002597CC90|nr:endonuclease/exonuclease/phosphatase family protein [uncultured Methanosphaera sp.]
MKSAYDKKELQKVFNENPDILPLQEVKSSLQNLDAQILYKKRYNNFFYPSSKQKGQSGVAIYTKYNPTSLIHGFNSSFDNEGRIQKIEFDKFNLYNVYFPLGATKESLKSKFEFYDLFMCYVNKSNKPQIICGDFNRIVSEIDGYNLDLLKKNNEFSSRKRKMGQ